MLFFSTLFATGAHIVCVSWATLPKWHAYSIAAGLATSILNHGQLVRRGRTIDRIIVRAAYVIDVYSIVVQPSCPAKKTFDALILGLAGISYVISKTFNNDCLRKEWHVLSHLLATLAHISMSRPALC